MTKKQIEIKNKYDSFIAMDLARDQAREILAKDYSSEDIEKALAEPKKTSFDEAFKKIDDRFKFYRDRKGIRYYEILSKKEKIVTSVEDLDYIKYETQILDAKVVKAWEMQKDLGLERPPSQISRIGDENYCFHKINVEPKEGDLSSWMEALERMHDKEGFAAWVYGVYSGMYVGRQALWLHGDGKDGKTAMLSVISEMFGESYTNISNNIVSNNSRFAYFDYVGKQLVGYADCNNTKIMLSEFMKGISSGDPVTIEVKGGGFFTTKLHAHPWIGSNFTPHILDAAHSLSRVFYIRINPSIIDDRKRGNFVQEIRNQLPAFLHYAKQCWNERALCNKQGIAEVISETDETKGLIKNMIGDDYYLMATEVFDLHQDHQMPWSDFQDIIGELYKGNKEQGNFKKYLTTKFQVAIDRNTRVVSGIKMK